MSARQRKQPSTTSPDNYALSGPAEQPGNNINTIATSESTALIFIKDYASLVSGVVFHWPLHVAAVHSFLRTVHCPTPVLEMFGPKNTFNPEKDIPDLTGKVAIVTGGNTGLGKCSVLEFARHGAKVYMASRTESKALQSISELKSLVPNAQIEFLHLDLSSLESVKHAAETFLTKESSLHILLNNAGVMAMPFELTKDGFDIQWGTNYIGHALFTKLLLPTLTLTAANSPSNTVRIVNLSSEGHRGARSGIDFTDPNLEKSSKWTRYGQSKLANILHAKALAKRYGEKGIVAVSCHPGVIYTDLYLPFSNSLGILGTLLAYPVKLFTTSLQEGRLNQIGLCTSPEITVEDGGAYFTPVLKKSLPSAYGQDDELADRLWDYTENLLKEKGY